MGFGARHSEFESDSATYQLENFGKLFKLSVSCFPSLPPGAVVRIK